MTTIIGVDFSGARADTNTWMTRGFLTSDGSLSLDSAVRIRRDDLYHALISVPTPAVAALDFPFGIPAQFAAHITRGHPAYEMSTLWDAVARMSADDFIAARDAFVAAHGEPKRAGDLKYHRESYSPLHTVNPNMVPMTYHGINLLRRWHGEHPRRWHVPPLPPAASAENTVALLELMPGALLRSLGLPFKGYKRGRDSTTRRTKILDSLATASGIAIPNLAVFRADCLANDDCLDSMVAAVGAAMWAQDQSRFRHPAPNELDDARLEGWIYVPAGPIT